MTLARIALAVAAVLLLMPIGLWLYFDYVANPRVIQELAEEPDGERARRVMLLTLPSGRRIPVNFIREDDRVYAAADGRWWRELSGEARAVTILLRGETLEGRARAVRDDPAYTKRIFAMLRPDAIEGFGTLIEIRLVGPERPGGGDPGA